MVENEYATLKLQPGKKNRMNELEITTEMGMKQKVEPKDENVEKILILATQNKTTKK